MSVKHLVVGAGVMGVTLTRALAQRGEPVLLMSPSEPGFEGASSAPAALLNPFRGRTGRATPEDRSALQQMWALVAELEAEGRSTGAQRGGVLRLIDSPAQRRSFAAVEGLELLEPGAVPPPLRAPHGAAFAAAAGSLEPRRFLRTALDSALAAGAEARFGARLEALEPSAGGWRCRTREGESLTAQRLWLCLGAERWPEQWARVLAAPPPIERWAGDIFPTDLPALRWPIAGGTYVAPLAGHAAVGGHHRAPGPPPEGAWSRLQATLRWAWPEIEGAAPRAGASWWGVRAHAAGNRPLVAEVAEGVTMVGALSGRGFLVAAGLAARLAAASAAGR